MAHSRPRFTRTKAPEVGCAAGTGKVGEEGDRTILVRAGASGRPGALEVSDLLTSHPIRG